MDEGAPPRRFLCVLAFLLAAGAYPIRADRETLQNEEKAELSDTFQPLLLHGSVLCEHLIPRQTRLFRLERRFASHQIRLILDQMDGGANP